MPLLLLLPVRCILGELHPPLLLKPAGLPPRLPALLPAWLRCASAFMPMISCLLSAFSSACVACVRRQTHMHARTRQRLGQVGPAGER